MGPPPARSCWRWRSRRSSFVAYLVILQLFVIDAVCIWCMVNDAVLVPLLAVLAFLRYRVRDEQAAC